MRLAFAVMRRAMFDSSEMEVPGVRHTNACQPSQRIFRTRVRLSRIEDSPIIVLANLFFPSRLRSIMRNMKLFLANLLILPVTSAAIFAQQPSARGPTIVEVLNAQAGQDDAGAIREYSEHLVQLLVGDKAGRAFAASLTDRLAMAELMARHGKRKLVSEADIASSFNDLMKRVGAPESLRTDVATVHRFRVGPLAASPVPALITVDRNGSNCNPGEAVFLMLMLVTNNGSFDDRLPAGIKPEDLPRYVGIEHPPAEPDARRILTIYLSQHSRIDAVELFSAMAKTLGL